MRHYLEHPTNDALSLKQWKPQRSEKYWQLQQENAQLKSLIAERIKELLAKK